MLRDLMASKGEIFRPFPFPYRHLQRYQDEFFSIYLSGAYVWREMPRNWRIAMTVQARVWHMIKLHLSKFV